MKLAELKSQTPDQLNETVLSLKKEMLTLRFQMISGEAKNPNELKKMRRTIARAKTLLRHQALGITAPAAAEKKAAKKPAAKKTAAKKDKKEE